MTLEERTLEITCLQKLYEEQRSQRRQSESQRSTLTNILILIDAGLIALMGSQHFSPGMLYIAQILMFFGLFGVLSSLKYYERSRLHWRRSRYYEKKIAELVSTNPIELREKADKDHQKEWPFLSKIHQFWLWIILHSIIIIIGGFFCIVTLYNYFQK